MRFPSIVVFLMFMGGVVPCTAALFSSERSVEEIRQKLSALPPERQYRTRAVLSSELGTLLYKRSQWVEAAEMFDAALNYGPPSPLKKHIYLYLGKSLESSGRLDKALHAYEQAAAYDQRNWRRHRDLAHLYEMVKLPQKAIASYEKALRLHPDEASLHFALGRLWMDLGYYEKSEARFLSALDQGYAQADVLAHLSHVFEKTGKRAEAASVLHETLGPNSSVDEWARLVYLSILSKNEKLLSLGLKELLARSPDPSETKRFYQDLKNYIDKGTSINPTLLAIFDGVAQKGENK